MPHHFSLLIQVYYQLCSYFSPPPSLCMLPNSREERHPIKNSKLLMYSQWILKIGISFDVIIWVKFILILCKTLSNWCPILHAPVCPPLQPPPKMYVPIASQGNISCGQHAFIRCFNGFRVGGAQSATCLPNGEYSWNGPTPWCIDLG